MKKFLALAPIQATALGNKFALAMSGLITCFMVPGSVAAAADKPYVLSCDIDRTGDVNVIGSGLGKKLVNESYQLKFSVDPAAKSVTSLLSFSGKKGNYSNNIFISDVRALSSSQLVFCMDEENQCRPYKKAVQGGTSTGTVEGQKSLHVINLTSGRISFSERLVLQSATQTVRRQNIWH